MFLQKHAQWRVVECKDKDNNENSDNNNTAKSTKWWSSMRELFRYLSPYMCVVCSALYFCWSHALGTRCCSYDCQRQDHISICYLCHSIPQIRPTVTVSNRPKWVSKFSNGFCANPFISSPYVKLFRAISKTGELSQFKASSHVTGFIIGTSKGFRKLLFYILGVGGLMNRNWFFVGFVLGLCPKITYLVTWDCMKRCRVS